jgi:hypothetical protein
VVLLSVGLLGAAAVGRGAVSQFCASRSPR